MHSTLHWFEANRYFLLLKLTESRDSGVGLRVRVFVRGLQTKRTRVALFRQRSQQKLSSAHFRKSGGTSVSLYLSRGGSVSLV